MADFTPEAMDKIAEAVRYVLANRSILGGGAQLAGSPAEAFTARCTSATADGSGNYPAVITRYDAPTAAYVDYGVCKLRTPNAEVPALGVNYPVTPAGTTPGGDPLYLVGTVASAGGITYVTSSTGGPITLGTTPVTIGGVAITSPGTYLFLASATIEIIFGAQPETTSLQIYSPSAGLLGHLVQATQGYPAGGGSVLSTTTFSQTISMSTTGTYTLRATFTHTDPASSAFANVFAGNCDITVIKLA